ncbi:MAG: hypothetical protein J7M24_05800 [Candidatus Latescibacteria bacterium]|nr:hypothetical protein [Candidatus Latescibacterota bacterium]
MKRSAFVIFVLVLAFATAAIAQENKLAFFSIDSDLATAGFQGGRIVKDIGGGSRVGFAIYVKNADQLRGYTVDFTWDAAKASFASDSGPSIDLDERKVNGVEVTLSEDNVLESVAGVGEVNEDGHYKIDYAKLGGDALASTEYGLVYLLVLKTDAGFTTEDSFTITAKVSALNDGGVKKPLGERDFYVNGAVDVKTSTWGEVKNQFKD